MKRTGARFKVGEDVIACVTKPDLEVGALGLVIKVWGSNRYIVQFNAAQVFMWGYELGHVNPAPSQDDQSTAAGCGG